jgi:RNA polymerase sigma-70 factor, ECF subfamily
LLRIAASSRFERAILPHRDAAHNLARWLLGSAQDAEDVVQEAYVRALSFFAGFHGEDGRAWLLAIVRNACFDFLRKNRNHIDIETLDVPARSPHPVVKLMIRESLEGLPPEYREVIVLREMEGMSYKQIARIAGIPIGTVMSRLARARARLEELLGVAK